VLFDEVRVSRIAQDERRPEYNRMIRPAHAQRRLLDERTLADKSVKLLGALAC
jgi:hypothetical protein